jgi:hypothetical protein
VQRLFRHGKQVSFEVITLHVATSDFLIPALLSIDLAVLGVVPDLGKLAETLMRENESRYV